MVTNSEIANLAQNMVYGLDLFIEPKNDSKLYSCTKLNECVYDQDDIKCFIDYFKNTEDFEINIKYFKNTDLAIYDIAENILMDEKEK